MSGMSMGDVLIPGETLPLIPYQSQDLARLIESFRQQQASGHLQLEVELQPGKYWQRVLIWYKGEITYGGHKLIDRGELIRVLVKKFKPEYSESIEGWLIQQLVYPHSTRELLTFLVRKQVLTWEQIETWAQGQTVFVLEQAIGFAGKYRFNPQPDIDFYHGEAGAGLNWNQLMMTVNTRQQYWSKIGNLIPGIGAIPLPLTAAMLGKIAEKAIAQHAQKWFDGHRTIVDIATALDRDPLQVARSYAQWAQMGWMQCQQPIDIAMESLAPVELPIVLSVDDSSIVQTRIKRALSERYEVLLANDAMSALHLLARQPVDLLLLDVTMPGIDGIELCQTLRRMSKFTQLPIVMLTAKDKSYDRALAEMVGATEYLTKPLDDEKLLAVVDRYTKRGHIQ
ncbi:PleD family two-component system response regulator [Chamaesiphon sp.]|uniref:response regulator n=1 Tax=Chamaesiphon sp. TaxID=2814140 RepID=UPI0035942C06